MTEPFQENLKNNTKPVWLLPGGLILIVLIAWGYLNYGQYATEVQRPSDNSLHVQIDSPLSHSQARAGQMLPIQVTAFSEKTISQIELWANGQLVKLIAKPEGEPGPFTAFFSWLPLNGGSHLLLARALDDSGRTGDSLPILIDVIANDKLSEEDKVAPSAPQNYSGPSPLSFPVGAPAPEADAWSPNLVEWVQEVIGLGQANELPEAPSLAALGQDCGTALTFQDISANEDGFKVYRSSANSSDWHLVATLASADGGLLSFVDSFGPGNLIYRVSAFNTVGEAPSNPVALSIPPEECPQPSISPFLQIIFTELTVDDSVEYVYCYVGGGDKFWKRWPESGFLQSVEGAIDINNPVILSQLIPEDAEAIDFKMELNCWGWLGDEIQFLGHSVFEGDLPTGTSQFEMSSANFVMQFDVGVNFDNAQYDYSPGIDFSDYLMRPEVVPIVGDLNLCESRFHLDSGFPEDFCIKSFGYATWPYEPTYAIWNHGYSKNCAAGIDCLNPTNPGPVWEDVPGVANGEFGYHVRVQGGWQGDIPTPLNRVFALPAFYGSLDCDRSTLVLVGTYFIPEGSNIRYTSSLSGTNVPQPCRKTDFVILDVAVEEVWITNPSEEANEGDTLELYGFFVLTDQFFNHKVLRLGAWDSGGDSESSFDAFCGPEARGFYPLDICPTRVDATDFGVYQVQDWYLCEGAISGNICLGGLGQNLIQSNNVFGEITVINWEDDFYTLLNSPLVSFSLWDWDLHSADDLVCEGIMTFSSANYPFAAYNDFDHYTLGFEVIGSGDDGMACLVQLSLTDIFSLIDG